MRHDCRTVRRSGRNACGGQYSWLRPGRAVTDPPEALAARCNLRLEHGCNAVAQPEVRRPDNTVCGAQIAVTPAGAFRRDTLHKLRLADNSEFFRPIGAIHRTALNEHRLPHILAPRVGDQMLEKIPLRRAARIIP